MDDFEVNLNFLNQNMVFISRNKTDSHEFSISKIPNDYNLSIRIPRLYPNQKVEIQPNNVSFEISEDEYLPNAYEFLTIHPNSSNILIILSSRKQTSSVPNKETSTIGYDDIIIIKSKQFYGF